MPSDKRIQVFEYDKLVVGKKYSPSQCTFKQRHFDALVKWNEFHNNQYFKVGHRNVISQNYVGVVQIDGLTIEILPKIDRSSQNKEDWQKALIEMLKATKNIKVKQVGNAQVNKQSIHLLDIYFEWYLNELQVLIHRGLIRQYYREQNNLSVLKGKLVFAKHISKNLVHKERFYTEHQTYERDHLIHQVLRKALDIVIRLSKGTYLYSPSKIVELEFPETSKIKVDQQTFNRIPLNRKTKQYQTALEIARLIILNFAPNITKGNENMLALLFNMNSLWESYVLGKLKKAVKETNYSVHGQESQAFWNSRRVRPDIVIKQENKVVYIIDTKWKVPSFSKPSLDDLRQMYVYNMYWDCPKSMLLYPDNEDRVVHKGIYWKGYSHENDEELNECALGFLNIFDSNNKLDSKIGDRIFKMIELQ
ncbi:hypothetical protein BTO09_06465 [Gilvibacter sp. SZ-19]|uniref:McrC family protein n=1 Tax=Gilvibacter sp. SZ-19 TaxID=754429 RepID=UPI000B3C7512|nr:hypothetical protein [Gilvibacter sp. SZ-19]ARV12010.1 hypothetical protein BTO09_06465 [Gilvibacter sp. SZ-19]